MKIGLQLYTLRKDLFTKDPSEVLHKVAELGYDGVEWFGLLPGLSAEKTVELTRKAGLEFFSMHTDINGITDISRDDLKTYADAGVRYIPIGWLPEDRIAGGEKFDETLGLIRNYASVCAEYGLKVLYHNHDFDLAKLRDGSVKLDRLYEALPEDILLAELDTCWIYSGGADTVGYVRKYASRTPILHLKDCIKEGGRKGFMPVGYGVLDFGKIIKESRSDWFCVEQDEPTPDHNEWECVRLSVEYLRKNF